MSRLISRIARAALGTGAGIVLVALAMPARAQASSDKAAAEALFEEGRALVTEKKFDDACKKFELSQQLDPAVGTLLYLADCYEQAGRVASAWATFREAASAAKRKGQTDREALARDLATALEPKLSKLSITVPQENAAPGLEIRRDGEVVHRGLWSVPIPVDPGTRRIEAKAPGRKPWTKEIPITRPGTSEIVVPALEKEATAAAAETKTAPPPAAATPTSGAPAEQRSSGGAQRAIGYVVGGAGVVGLGVAGLFALRAMSKNSEAESHCGADGFCDHTGFVLGEEAKSSANAATLMSIGGLVAIAAGTTLILTAPNGASEAPRTSRRLDFTADLGPGRASLGAFGSW